MTIVIEDEPNLIVEYHNPTDIDSEVIGFNLQKAAAELREKLSAILSTLSLEEKKNHHDQIKMLMDSYERLAKHHEVAAQEITVALVGCAFGIIAAGFDDKGSAGRALSGISSFLYKTNDLIQGLNEATKANINADIKYLEILMQDLNRASDDTRNFRREVDKMLNDVEETVSRIIQKCS